MTATHTETARNVARDTGWNLDDHAADHEWTAVGLGPVGQHRDSDALARSNWTVVLADLTERFGDSVADVSFGHWGVGWVEEISWDAGREDVAAAVQEWRDALSDYPVADESHYSELETEELYDALDWAYNVPAEHREAVARELFEARSICRIEELSDDDVSAAMADLGLERE